MTLTFLRLGKIAPPDAVFFIVAQLVGGTLGVFLVALALGEGFTDPPVAYVATVPGATGVGVAFIAELLISMGLMLVILFVSNTERLARYTGLYAGCLVAVYITFEAPLSGVSMNPARTFASAAAGGTWADAWIYFTAPILGMLAAVEIHRALGRVAGHEQGIKCAKLDHPPHVRCIHCGYVPPEDRHDSASIGYR